MTIAFVNGEGDLQIYIQVARGSQCYRKDDIPSAVIPEAKDVWITSTTKEIMPATTINDIDINAIDINGGKVGGYWKIINNSFYQLLR